MPIKPLEVKRVGIAPMVAPVTREAIKRLAGLVGLSQGEIVDDAIAGMVFAYADAPLEDGETIGRSVAIDFEMVERATTRVPVRIEVPEHLTLDAVGPPAVQGRGKATIAIPSPRPFRGPLLRPSQKKG